MENNKLISLAKEKIDSFDTAGLIESGLVPVEGSYFPSIYYPPITMYSPGNEEDMFEGFEYNKADPLCAYIHIPFCPTQCVFCHWATSVGDSEEDMDRYVKYLEKEMDLWRNRLGMDIITPTSVLLGGGTPSMLLPGQIEYMLKSFGTRFDLTGSIQVSCEVEPGTILGDTGMDKLKALKENGVNRISLGAQSFDDEVLKAMGRAHSVEDTKRAIEQVRKAGYESLSIDLIYGIPGDTMDKWIRTLNTAFTIGVDACQIYRLRIVPHGDKKGKIKNSFDKAPENFHSVEDVYLMKELGIVVAGQNGFEETSRRMFTKAKEHNSEYLQDHTDRLQNVSGIGISAWSNIQGRAFLNTGENVEDYYSYLEKGKMPVNRGKIRTEDDQERWAVILPLKHNGINKKLFKQKTGKELNEVFGKKICNLKVFGLVEEDEETVALTEKGRFFADEVTINFYQSQYIPFPEHAYKDGVLNPYLEEGR